jgi:hypothetical protein
MTRMANWAQERARPRKRGGAAQRQGRWTD